MTSKNKLKVGDIFTREELERATLITSDESDDKKLSTRLREEITKPALKRINETTKQDNSAEYLAFLLEFCIRYGKDLNATVHADYLKANEPAAATEAPAENH